jgi:hypothetical protein
MEKIIGGRKYSTDTAKELGVWWNGLGTRDFSHCREALYSKRNGEFFLYGEGGPKTKYAVSHGNNSWSGGEDIIPLSADAARAWAEHNLEAKEYEAIFGEVDEGPADDGTEKGYLTCYMSASVIAKIKRMATAAGKAPARIVEEAFKEES